MRTHSLRLIDRLSGSSGSGRVLRRHARSMMLGGGVLMLAGVVFAQGGTAKPPAVSGVPSNPFFPAAGPLTRAFGTVGFPAPSSTGDTGFSVSGQAQAVSLLPAGAVCAGPGGVGQTNGGTITINGMVINVPANTIVQFPANSLTFADMICPTNLLNPAVAAAPSPPVLSSLAFDASGGAFTAASNGGVATPVLPSVEFSIDGNILGSPAGGGTNAGIGSIHVAGLISASQQSLNAGAGYIRTIDYTDGSIYVSSPTAAGGVQETRLLIADPVGRYGRQQTVPDLRFSVDTANPTIKSGATGYPMCVPRFNPATRPDPQCPQTNRPSVPPGTVGGCRTFTNVLPGNVAGNAALVGFTAVAGGGVAATPGFRIGGADIAPAPPPGSTFCTSFVMPALAGYPGAVAAAALQASNVVALTATGALAVPGPDPREQVPFEVGDFIQWSGTLVRANAPVGSNVAGGTETTNSQDVIWVHTIDANVAIFTQPRTLPAYVGVGQLGIGTDPQPKTAAAIPGVEATAKIFLEANTSDVGSIVDIYHDDKGFGITPATTRPVAAGGNFIAPVPGGEYFRWMTPENMTGTLAFQAAVTGRLFWATSAQPFGGGIETQYVGPQPGRARIRASSTPAINPGRICPSGGATGSLTVGADQGCAVTNSPTRYVRVALRSLCAPALNDNAGALFPATNLDNGVVAAGTPWIDINAPTVSIAGGPATAPQLPGVGPGLAVPGDTPTTGLCVERAQFANGLFTGQYMAPMGEFIFPENTLAGTPVVPENMWNLGFLVYGEGGGGGSCNGFFCSGAGTSAAAPAPSPW